MEEKISKWIASARVGREEAKSAEKAKEREEEEKKKAKAKKMSLEQYRAWRDRELWTNEYNAIRKNRCSGRPSRRTRRRNFGTPEETGNLGRRSGTQQNPSGRGCEEETDPDFLL